MLADKHINEFQEVCKKHLGIELEFEEAREQAQKLVQMVSAVHRYLTEEKPEKTLNS